MSSLKSKNTIMYILKKCLTKSKSAAKEIKAENYIMETLFLKKSISFTNKLSRAEQNLGGTCDDIKARDDIRTNDGCHYEGCHSKVNIAKVDISKVFIRKVAIP